MAPKLRGSVAVAALMLAVHLPYLQPRGAWARGSGPMPVAWDEGTYLYDSLRTAQGEVIYRDFFEFSGPLFWESVGWTMRVTGSRILAPRVLLVLVAAATATLLALAAWRLSQSALLGVALGLVHASLLFGCGPYVGVHWPAELLGAAAALCLLRPGGGARLAAGALGAACLLHMQSLGAPLLAALAAAAAARAVEERSLAPLRADLGWLAAGAAAVIAPTALWLAWRGALGAALDAMFVWPFSHYRIANETRFGEGIEQAVRAHAGMVRPLAALAVWNLRAIPAACWLALVAAAAGLVRWGAALVRPGRLATGPWAPLCLAALAALAPAYASVTRRDVGHLAAVSAISLLPVALWAGTCRPLRLVATVAATALAASTLLVHAVKLAGNGVAPPTEAAWRARALPEGDGGLFSVLTRPGDRIFTGLMGGWVYLLSRPAAVGFTFVPAYEPRYLSDAQWARLAAEVDERRPPLVRLRPTQVGFLARRWPGLRARYQPLGAMLYALVEPGPHPAHAVWRVTAGPPGGRALELDVRGTTVTGQLGGRPLRGFVRGRFVGLLGGPGALGATLSDDGRRLAGEWTDRRRVEPFAARR